MENPYDEDRYVFQPIINTPEQIMPTYDEFQDTMNEYLTNLSPKKQSKALIDHERYCLIQQVLRNPRDTTISTAQFRFWVKKMFRLQHYDVVCHENKPVAMKEQIYGILANAHKEALHGGRDKTASIVKTQYSWIPKELVARFVRQCPTCIQRRNGSSQALCDGSPNQMNSHLLYTPSTDSASTSPTSMGHNNQPYYPPNHLQYLNMPYKFYSSNGLFENNDTNNNYFNYNSILLHHTDSTTTTTTTSTSF